MTYVNNNNAPKFQDLDKQMVRDALRFERNDLGDVSITLDKVIITHLNQWTGIKIKSFLRRNTFNQRALDIDSFGSTSIEEISEARITFHRQDEFIEIFRQSGISFEKIHKSLDINYNRE